MPNYSIDLVPLRESAAPAVEETPSAPLELAAWLEQRLPSVRVHWLGRIRARDAVGGSEWDQVVDSFVGVLCELLVPVLGPFRRDVEPLWLDAAELFGRAAASRGLAAGEVIEELQILRELVIRDLYRDPPIAGRARLSLRDILMLNRAIDRVVTHGSVGHTDALFFQLFDADAEETPTSEPEATLGVMEQLGVIRREVKAICAPHSGSPDAGDNDH